MKNILFACLLAVSCNTFGQLEKLNISNSIPPSPSASSLGKYGDIPVSLYTGVPSINIPLYSVQNNNLSLPISLSYHSSGFKVEDVASSVGLGWSLNAGGVITRAVKGVPDDFNGDLWGLTKDAGMKVNGMFVFYQAPSYGFLSTGNSIENETYGSLGYNTKDGESDIYYFNFNGNSGSFVFNKDGVPKLFSKNNLDITYNRNGNGDIDLFKVIDGDGFIYTFAVADVSQVKNNSFTEWECMSMYGGFCSYDDYYYYSEEDPIAFPGGAYTSAPYYAAWYLTKIENPNLTNEITLNYETEGQTNLCNFNEQYVFNLFNNNSYSVSNSEIKSSCMRVKEIFCGNSKVVFNYNHNRQDLIGLSGYNLPGALTNASMYRKNNDNSYTLLNQYEFTYSYLVSTDFPNTYGKRLMLSSVTEKDNLGNAKPSYTFEYNTSVPVRIRSSMIKDFWGFQKTTTPTPGASKIPKYYVDHNSTLIDFNVFGSAYSVYQGSQNQCYFGGDYDISPEAAGQTAFLLTKINYPTKGSTSFEYEPNSFVLFGINRIGGGARIKKITDYDGLDHNRDIIKNYSYVQESNPALSSGVVMSLPTFVKKNQACGNTNECTVFTSNIGVLGSTHGSLVGYNRVIIEFNGNGKIVSLFNTQGNINSLSEECDINNNCIYKKTFSEGSCQDDNFPFGDNPNFDWYRGVLQEELVYDNANRLVKKTVNSYTVKNYEKIKAIKESLYGRHAITEDDIVKTSKYYYLSGWKVPSSQTVTTYDPLQTGKKIESITNYFYDNANHLQLTKTTNTDSKGQIFETIFKRSKDYTNTGGMIANLNNQHRLNEVIESQTWLQGSPKKLLGAKFNSYADFKNQNGLTNTQCLVQQQYQLETSSPIPQSNFTETWFDDGDPVLDSRYKPVVMYNFDNKDNLTRQSALTNGSQTNASVIYGHNKSLTIAQIGNAKESDCGFTSFESDDQNLWTIGATTNLITNDGHCGTSSRSIPPNTFGPTRNYTISATAQDKKFILSCWVKTNSNVSGTIGSLVLQSIDPATNTLYPNVSGAYKATLLYNTNNVWKYVEVEIDLKQIKTTAGLPLNTILGISSFVWNQNSSVNIQVDDIRFYPKDARMTSYTHNPLIGISSMSDENSNCQYYEYDNFGRLKMVKDQDGKILEKTDYNYKP